MPGGFPWLDERPVVEQAAPYVALFSAGMLFAATFLPRASNAPLYWFVLFWLLLLVVALQFMTARGIDYVNWPRLNPLTENIFYEGPGYYSGRKGRAGVKGLSGKNMKKTVRGKVAASGPVGQVPIGTSPAGATGVAPTLTSVQQRRV